MVLDQAIYAKVLEVKWKWDDAEDALASGELSLQQSDHLFAQVAVDTAIEQTVGRDTKTPGGLIEISTNASACNTALVADSL